MIKINYIDRFMDRYIINDKAVIIFWNDGNKTIAKVDGTDKFDKEIGFMLAFYKYLYFHLNCRPYSKSEVKKILNSVSDLKTYLFVMFNKYTFQDTIKTKKFLNNLKEGKR